MFESFYYVVYFGEMVILFFGVVSVLFLSLRLVRSGYVFVWNIKLSVFGILMMILFCVGLAAVFLFI